MEETLADYRSWAQDRWSPVVAVGSSQRADEHFHEHLKTSVVCALSHVRELKGLNGGLGVPVRTPAEHPIRLYNWKIRFYDNKACQPFKEVGQLDSKLQITIKDCVRSNMIKHGFDYFTELGGPLPWFGAYQNEFFELLQFQVHETQDDPLIFLFVIHEDEVRDWKRVVANLEEACPNKLRICLRNGRCLRHVVFVRNQINGHNDFESAFMNEMRAMNGGLPCALNMQGNRLQQQQEKGGTDSIVDFVHELVSKRLIHHIEDRIRKLEETISSSRRGLKNQLKSLLFRRPAHARSESFSSSESAGQEATGISNEIKELPPESVEASMREQSDLCLMVNDFDTALATLKLLSSDLKSDKLFFHYASSQECMAFAYLLSGTSISDTVTCFREAFYKYSSVIDQQTGMVISFATMYGTRAAIQLARYLACLRRYTDASWISMKAHFQESSMRAALLLDYAASLLLRQDPPKYRKYGFHLVLAALRYGQSGEFQLAAVAHSKVLQIYKGRGWDIIEEHVREALGKERYDAGHIADALHHFHETLKCEGLPSRLQSLHFAHFRNVYQEAIEKKIDVSSLEVAIPYFDTCHVQAISSGRSDYANKEAREASENSWKEIESFLLKKSVSGTWLDGLKPINTKESVCVGEDVGIEIRVHNPLKIDLQLSDLSLICSVEASIFDNGKAPETLVHIPEEKMTLYPGEKALVHLRCKPLAVGSLKVEGIKWKLEGGIVGVKMFKYERSKWSIEDESRDESIGGPLLLQILPPMPRLQVSVQGVPENLYSGEIVRCKFLLSNIGSMTLHKIAAVASPLLCFAEGAVQNTENEPNFFRKFDFMERKIEVNEQVEIFGYLRSNYPGHPLIHISWKYEPVIKMESLQFRTLRFSQRLTVLPSLDVRTTLVPSFKYQKLFLQASNLQGMTSFQINDLLLKRIPNEEDSTPDSYSRFEARAEVLPESSVTLHLDTEKNRVGVNDKLTSFEEYFVRTWNEMASQRSDSRKVVSVLRWNLPKSESENPDGHVSRTGITVNASKNTSSQKIFAKFQNTGPFVHDFEKGPLVAKVVLQIHSDFPQPVDLFWNLGPRHPQNQLHITQGSTWCGKVSGSCPDFKPGDSKSIESSVLITKRGITRLHDAQISWHCRTEPQLAGSLVVEPLYITVSEQM